MILNHSKTIRSVISLLCNGRYRMGHLGQMLTPPHLVEEPAILLIKILNFMSGQDQFSYKTRENMHILLVFITNSPETKVKLAVKLLPSTYVHT